MTAQPRWLQNGGYTSTQSYDENNNPVTTIQPIAPRINALAPHAANDTMNFDADMPMSRGPTSEKRWAQLFRGNSPSAVVNFGVNPNSNSIALAAGAQGWLNPATMPVPATTTPILGVSPAWARNDINATPPTGYGDSFIAQAAKRAADYHAANDLPLPSGVRNFRTPTGIQPTIVSKYGYATASNAATGDHYIGDETGDRTAQFTQPRWKRPLALNS